MLEALLLLFATVLAYAGFALLALSQLRHWNAVGCAARTSERQHGANGAPSAAATHRHRQGLRAAGYTVLVLTYLCTWLRDGPAFGSLLWVLLISLAAGGVAFTLSRRPRSLRWLLLQRRAASANAPGAQPFKPTVD